MGSREKTQLAVSESSPGSTQGTAGAIGSWSFPRAKRKFANRKLLSHRVKWLRADRLTYKNRGQWELCECDCHVVLTRRLAGGDGERAQRVRSGGGGEKGRDWLCIHLATTACACGDRLSWGGHPAFTSQAGLPRGHVWASFPTSH